MIFDKMHFLIRIRIRIHNLKLRTRIRILQKVSDPYGSGSTIHCDLDSALEIPVLLWLALPVLSITIKLSL
jgi:hypothetical protein